MAQSEVEICFSDPRALCYAGRREEASQRLMPAEMQHKPGHRASTKVTKTKGSRGTIIMADKLQNLQDTFLNTVRKSKTPLTIFLVNGVKLQGVITWYDNFCVLLRRDGMSQLVYKHAISTIMPGQPVSLFDEDERSSDG